MTDDDVHSRPTLAPPAPEAEIEGEPPALESGVIQEIPVEKRTAFDNLVLEVRGLRAHVEELQALVLRTESSVQTLIATVHAFEAVIKFSVEQMTESVSSAAGEILRSRQAVVELAPRVHRVEERMDVIERRRASNGEH